MVLTKMRYTFLAAWDFGDSGLLHAALSASRYEVLITWGEADIGDATPSVEHVEHQFS